MTDAKVLFVGPDLDAVGGVATYCKAVMAAYPGQIHYVSFPVEVRRHPWRLMVMLGRFLVLVGARAHHHVHLNTSLNGPAILRDAVFLLLGTATGKRAFVTIHGWEDSFEGRLTGLWRRLFVGVLAQADTVLVLGTTFKQRLERFGIQRPILIARTCVGPDALAAAAEPRPKRTANGPVRILFLSRIVREKGCFDLLEASAALRRQHPLLELDIAGDGPDLADLKAAARQHGEGWVRFHGQVTGEAKFSLFRQANVFALPTYYGEGLPICVLEAMAFGLPVVVTPVGGLPDVIVDGVHGRVVTPRQPDKLLEALMELMACSDMTATMGERNAAFVGQAFTADAIARELHRVHLDGNAALCGGAVEASV